MQTHGSMFRGNTRAAGKKLCKECHPNDMKLLNHTFCILLPLFVWQDSRWIPSLLYGRSLRRWPEAVKDYDLAADLFGEPDFELLSGRAQAGVKRLESLGFHLATVRLKWACNSWSTQFYRFLVAGECCILSRNMIKTAWVIESMSFSYRPPFFLSLWVSSSKITFPNIL